jgi:5'-phosphate synthase pdxT subunit
MNTIGILALQGNFALHQTRIEELGAETRLVKCAGDLADVDGIVIPGGESTTLLRLIDSELKEALVKRISEGLSTLATCAGLILLAKRVHGPSQESLELIDVEVTRNAYGRQVDSFVDGQLHWSSTGRNLLAQYELEHHEKFASTIFEGVFIRAPRISSVGENIEVLVERGDEAVFVRQGNILGLSFHPELSDESSGIHQLFLAVVRANSNQTS